MFAVSFLSVMVILLLTRPEMRVGYFTVSVITAFVTSLVELYSKNGLDTLTCPVAAAVIMISLVHL